MKKFNAWDFMSREEMVEYINENGITVITVVERSIAEVQAGLWRFTVYGYKEIV